MLETFNAEVDCLGDAIFGDDATAEGFGEFIEQLEIDDEKKFMECCEKALLIEDPWTLRRHKVKYFLGCSHLRLANLSLKFFFYNNFKTKNEITCQLGTIRCFII